MKAKLKKESDGNYTLTLNNPKECSYSLPLLSKQNCDSLFGLVDVEELAIDIWKDLGVFTQNDKHLWFGGFRNGFKKALELIDKLNQAK